MRRWSTCGELLLNNINIPIDKINISCYDPKHRRIAAGGTL
jgi:hypothetical protein